MLENARDGMGEAWKVDGGYGIEGVRTRSILCWSLAMVWHGMSLLEEDEDASSATQGAIHSRRATLVA
jgi:hypothetical protein